jgi:DNA-binding NtrC family response regulator
MAKVLVIDDDDALRQFLQDLLVKRGYQVRCLERAEGGVVVLAAGEFDLVLVDESMPGLSGSQFLTVLRQKGIGIPAILMTGLAQGKLSLQMKGLDALVVGKPAGGHDEFWKDLEPVLERALKRDSEILAAIGHAVNIAVKAGKTSLVANLRRLLDHELLARVLAEVNGNTDEATRILGMRPAQLLEEMTPKCSPLSFQTEALVLIANHPELTADAIAERLGCSRSTLYRDKLIKGALKIRGAGYRRPPSGTKSADGDIEAFDDR